MRQSVTLQHRGLYTYPNPLSARPEGSLQIAKNLTIDRENTAEPRRGYSELDYPLGVDTNNRANQVLAYGNSDLLVHYGLADFPDRIAFLMQEEVFSCTIASGSNVISDIISTSSFHSSAIVKGLVKETTFQGDQTLGSNTLTNILSTQGLYVGLEVGGRGIPLGTTITSISGTGPYSVVISNNALATQAGNTITATNANLITLPTNSRAVVINSSNIVLDNNAGYTSRTLTFNPADVTILTDIITIANHGLVDGDQVQFTTTGTLPAPLISGAVYYIVQSNNSTFKLSATSNGSPIDLTTQGTGVHTMTIRDIFTIGGWIDYPGIFENPTGNVKTRYAEQNNSLFITTSDGVRKIDNIKGINITATVTHGSNQITNCNILDVEVGELVLGPGIPDGSFVTNLLSANSFQISNNVSLPTGVVSASGQTIRIQPRLAGTPYALDGQAVLTASTTGFLPTDRAVQYYIVWGYKDANDRIARGAPSSRSGIVVSNSTGSVKNVQLTFTIPDGITPAHFYQIYRSGFSATAADVPPSEARLIYEANPSYTSILNKILTYTDAVPEELRTGEILYTSESQEGVEAGNLQPLFAKDIASFKNSLFVSNTRTKQQLGLTILSVSGSFSILGNTDNSTAFKSLTISNPSLTVTGDTTSGSNVISNLTTSEMAVIAIGMPISGAGIPANSYVTSYASPTSITITNNATATAAGVTLTLGIIGVNPGQTVSGTPFASGTKITDIFTPSTLVDSVYLNDPFIYNVPNVAQLKVGQPISATAGIPAGTLIQAVYTQMDKTFADTSVDPSTETFTIADHGLETGVVVNFIAPASPASLPGGISANTNYYVISATTDTFQVSLSFGGAAHNISSVGSGTVRRINQVVMTNNATATLNGVVIDFGAGYRIDTPVTATTTGTLITLTNGNTGVQVGNTLTIAGITYTASTVENYTGANRNFKVYAHGTPAQNIANTAQSLIRVINRQTGAVGNPDVYAEYTSQINNLPGEMLIQARTYEDQEFYATANSVAAGQAYIPALPGPGGTTIVSENEETLNNLAYSKTDLPEAFPVGYQQQVGNEKSRTIRIVPLRDSLFNLKEDGVFRVVGESPESFGSFIFDNTITLDAPESIATLENTILALSRQGVIAITDSKSENISMPIQNLVLDIFEKNPETVTTLSFAFAYQSERKYVLFTIKESTDTTATQAFVYNARTNTWTTWELPRTCGLVLKSDDLIYLGRADKNTLKVERKDRKYTDYLDDNFDVDIQAVTGVLTAGSNIVSLILPDTTHLTVGQTISGTGIPAGAKIQSITNAFNLVMNKQATITGLVELAFENNRLIRLNSTSDITEGDVLYQNSGRFSIITEVDKIKNTVYTRNPINSWTDGPSQILTAIETVLQYNPQFCKNPSAMKQVTEFIAMFETPFFDTASVSFSSDISLGEEATSIEGQIGGVLWGLYPWGKVIWGGIVRPAPVRTLVPRDKQRNTQLNITLTHREAYAFYRLSGIELYFSNVGQRVRR